MLVWTHLIRQSLSELVRLMDSKPKWVVERIRQRAKETGITNPKIACLGLAFKPDIDDLRESPAILVASALMELNIDVVCVEPNIEDHPYLSIVSLDAALKYADVIVKASGASGVQGGSKSTIITPSKCIRFLRNYILNREFGQY